MSHPNVYFDREIHEGTSGKDVIAHKIALSHARPDIYKWQKFSPYSGHFFINAVVKFKTAHGLGQDPKIGTRTHELLEQMRQKNHPELWAFDANSIQLAKEFHEATIRNKIRSTGVAAAMFWYAHRYSTAYSQARPFPIIKPPQVASRLDCSGFATLCWYASGGPDPNGRGYDGQGYTGTLKNHGTRVYSVEELRPLDLIFYGFSAGKPGFNPGDPPHAAVYGGNPMVVSNGSYPMRYTVYNYRRDINHYRHYEVGV